MVLDLIQADRQALVGIIVQKFGGTSVATHEKIRAAAKRAIAAKEAGHQVVLVLSARGKKTDELVAMATEMQDPPDPRSYDMLVAVGEQESVSLAVMALAEMGHKAVALTGGQAGILTDDAFTRARIRRIDTTRMRRHLDAGEIVIVCGFQGVNDDGDITTLGRGGSDTTATALAAALKADECEIYTDVEGVFSTDPRKVSAARQLESISHDEMLELASLGSGVLHSRSVEFAKKYRVPLRVRPSFNNGVGTLISSNGGPAAAVTGLAVVADECRVTLKDLPDTPGVISTIVNAMASRSIPIDMMVQNVAVDGKTDITFTVPQGDLADALTAASAATKELGTVAPEVDANVGKVSAVGRGMVHSTGTAAKMFRTLSDRGINIQLVTTSEIKVSALVERGNCLEGLQAVHEAFALKSPPSEVVDMPVESQSEAASLDAVVEQLASMEDIVVRDVDLDTTQARLTIFGIPDEPGVAATILETIAAAGIPVDMIVQNSSDRGKASLTVTLDQGDLVEGKKAMDSLADGWVEATVSSDQSIAKLSVAGVGLRSHTGVGQKMFAALAEAGVNVQIVATSEIRVSVVVPSGDAEKAAGAVRKAFALT